MVELTNKINDIDLLADRLTKNYREADGMLVKKSWKLKQGALKT